MGQSDEKRAYDREYDRKERQNRPEYTMWHDAKQRARKRGKAFNLTLDDIIIPEFCPVLNIPLYKSPEGRTGNTPSLDRIDNTKGYIKGNVAVISWEANLFKRNHTLEDFERMVTYLKGTLPN